MNTTTKVKPTMWFWLISAIALLWNLAGTAAYLGQAYAKEEMMAGYTEVQKTIMNNLPAWITGAFALAVFTGVFGCIGLLLKKKWAQPFLMISLISVLARTFHFFFMTNGTEVFSFGEGTIMPIITVIISAFLVIFSKVAIDKKWIA